MDLGEQGYAVVKVNKVLPREAPPPDVAKQERQQYAQGWAAAENLAYYNLLKERFKVQITVPKPAGLQQCRRRRSSAGAAMNRSPQRARAAGCLCSLRGGVADGTRTHDNRNHNPGLYQLSYSHRRDSDYSGAPAQFTITSLPLTPREPMWA